MMGQPDMDSDDNMGNALNGGNMEEPVGNNGGFQQNGNTDIPAPDDSIDSPDMDNQNDENEPNIDNSNDGDDGQKKEIQKLAGKLSELLHSYNDENGEDEELNKYVKGMIDAQTGGDDESDEDEDDMDSEEELDNDGESSENETDDENIDSDEDNQDEGQDEKLPNNMKEGVIYTKRQISENFGTLNPELSGNRKQRGYIKNRNRTGNVKHSPFNPPKFK